MGIGANLGATANWAAILDAAKKVDDYGFDAVGFLDHYQAPVIFWELFEKLELAVNWLS